MLYEVITLFWLAETFRDLGLLEQAIAHAETALAIAPDSAAGWQFHGDLAEQLGDRGRTSRLLGEAVRRSPDDARTLDLYVESLFEDGRPADAMDALRRSPGYDGRAESLPLILVITSYSIHYTKLYDNN